MKKDKKETNYKPIEYICAKCGTINEISVDDNYMCGSCLFTILYKKKKIGVKKIVAV